MIKPKAPRGHGCSFNLIYGPFLSGLGRTVNLGRGKSVKSLVIGRVCRDQLPLEMCGKLSNFNAGLCANTLHLVAIVLTVRGFAQIE